MRMLDRVTEPSNRGGVEAGQNRLEVPTVLGPRGLALVEKLDFGVEHPYPGRGRPRDLRVRSRDRGIAAVHPRAILSPVEHDLQFPRRTPGPVRPKAVDPCPGLVTWEQSRKDSTMRFIEEPTRQPLSQLGKVVTETAHVRVGMVPRSEAEPQIQCPSSREPGGAPFEERPEVGPFELRPRRVDGKRHEAKAANGPGRSSNAARGPAVRATRRGSS